MLDKFNNIKKTTEMKEELDNRAKTSDGQWKKCGQITGRVIISAFCSDYHTLFVSKATKKVNVTVTSLVYDPLCNVQIDIHVHTIIQIIKLHKDNQLFDIVVKGQSHNDLILIQREREIVL